MTNYAVNEETWPIGVWAPGLLALRRVDNTSEPRRNCEAGSALIIEHGRWQRDQGRQGTIAIPRLVILHRRSRCAALARLSRVIYLPWHVRLVTEHEEKSVHGRAASVGRLLAEAKDYSRVEFIVNVYFRHRMYLHAPVVQWIKLKSQLRNARAVLVVVLFLTG